MVINKNITIQGNGSKNNVIIDSQRLSEIFTIANNINVAFINIIFINAYTTSNGRVVYNPYSSTTINAINCIFANNTARDGGTIYTYDNNGVINNNNFINNTANVNGGAIFNYGSDININNNNFTNNNASLTAGRSNHDCRYK